MSTQSYANATANADRKAMETALKAGCVPALRNLGFRGSFPKFYRDDDGFVALVHFQFYSSGGSFCVNLGYADPQRTNVYFAPDAPANKLTVSATRDQCRLGAVDGGDHWFSFGTTTYGTYRGDPEPVDVITDRCAKLLATEAEGWWRAKQQSCA